MNINLTLIISANCQTCYRALNTLAKIRLAYPNLLTEIIDINYYHDKRILITPALLINNHLFCYGDIDEKKLLAEII